MAAQPGRRRARRRRATTAARPAVDRLVEAGGRGRGQRRRGGRATPTWSSRWCRTARTSRPWRSARTASSPTPSRARCYIDCSIDPARRRGRSSPSRPPRRGLRGPRRPGQRRRGRRDRGQRCRSWSAATPTTSSAAPPVLEAVGKTIVHVGPAGRRADRQGGQPADRRRHHRAGRRGDRVPGGVRRGHGRPRSRCSPAAWPATGSWSARRPNMLAREFAPGFRIDLHHKDMGIVTAAAREAGVAIPLGSHVAQLVAAAAAPGPRRPRPLRAAAARRAAVRPHRTDKEN